MFAWFSARLSERSTQIALVGALVTVSQVASHPEAWATGSLPLWLAILPAIVTNLANAVVPEGSSAPPISSPVIGALLAVLLMGGALSACSNAPPTASPMQSDLLAAETAFNVAVTGAEVYAGLPDCSTGAKLCSDGQITADIVKAIAGARIAFGQADIAILGCSSATWRAVQAGAPSATCGIPIKDMDAQGQVLAAARAALLTAVGLVPVIQQ